MSDLQCPVRIVAVPTDIADADVVAAAEGAGLRAVYAAENGPVAARLAGLAATDITIEPELSAEVVDALESLADLHRGETIAVVCELGAIGLLLTRVGVHSEAANQSPLVVDIDADGWRLVTP